MGHIFSFVILMLAVLMGKPWSVDGLGDLLLLLTDGFFVSGVLLLAVGGLGYVSEKGGFDMLGYTFSSVIKKRKGESYYSYVTSKKAGRKWLSPLIDGAVMLGLSAMLAALWQSFAG